MDGHFHDVTLLHKWYLIHGEDIIYFIYGCDFDFVIEEFVEWILNENVCWFEKVQVQYKSISIKSSIIAIEIVLVFCDSSRNEGNIKAFSNYWTLDKFWRGKKMLREIS